uniref:DNA mismatch repair proteins mutS family domain-containing protein n=1 Tax=Chromera velia CCMP2878 TaxID=1169474 RepID=A0A0G4I158_9ALVE|eukprot:Cvel_48.t1-p1 / transcript=Cvel_48.t1 / gene=Cvel_48 / organism=Chromera_velia_CCMP2878 / gene_product=MutS protein homolog 4, putative / transcript_product=MutS protein homolog 4, putative / location=Cvel_scaffold5:279309-282533(+) / protein_length=648 / sequence_SO=supercontig / SO=protein_coding / is_pseudo=false
MSRVGDLIFDQLLRTYKRPPKANLTVHYCVQTSENGRLYEKLSELFQLCDIKLIGRKYFCEDRGLLIIRESKHRNEGAAELASKYVCLAAFAALCRYVEFTNKTILSCDSLKFTFRHLDDRLIVDHSTVKHLELLKDSIHGKEKNSLFSLFTCRTVGGSKRLRQTLLAPCGKAEEIEARLDVVEYFLSNENHFFECKRILSHFDKVDLLISRFVSIPHQRDQKWAKGLVNSVLHLKHILEVIPMLHDVFKEIAEVETAPELLKAVEESLQSSSWTEILERITADIEDDASFSKQSAQAKMNIFKAMKAGRCPNLDVARKCYAELILFIREHVAFLYSLSYSISTVDMLLGFAQAVTVAPGKMVRPTFTEDGPIAIRQLDFYINGPCTFQILTGPNGAGKSVYLRTVALINILGHAGCFVPAETCHLRLMKRLFTRFGTGDSLEEGASTFSLEMRELAYIERQADSRSLVLVDELGRGTGTTDAVSVSWAFSEKLIKTKGLVYFVCHPLPPADEIATGGPLPASMTQDVFRIEVYHRDMLSACTLGLQIYTNARNMHLACDIKNDTITPLFNAGVGVSEAVSGYGILCARAAGFPEEILQDAKRTSALVQRDAVDAVAEKPKDTRRESGCFLSNYAESLCLIATDCLNC